MHSTIRNHKQKVDHQDDVLMLKLERQESKDTVEVGDSVLVMIAGKWEDLSEFEAYDCTRAMRPRR